MNLLRASTLLPLVAFPLTARADDLGTATGFNVFIFGNASPSGGHADGAVAVGGNTSGSDHTTLSSNLPATVGADGNIGLYVGGNVGNSPMEVLNGGNARVGGAVPGS